MTLVASAMAGGDCIDDADVFAHRGDGLHPWAARSRRHPPWGPSCQLPVGPRPPAGPGEPGAAGPGLGRWGPDPATRRSPSTSIPPSAETYGLAKGAPATTAIPASGGYHPLLAIAAGTGDG